MLNPKHIEKAESVNAPGRDLRRGASHPVIDAWLEAVNEHDVKKVCALYAPGAILLPTLSEVICESPQQIEAYFSFFLNHTNLRAELLSCYVQQYSEIKIDSGIYAFCWDAETPGQTQSARARFTFVIRDALIVEHHSSMAPRLGSFDQP